MQVTVKFLGSPSLALNGHRILFPTQKITALVFYLLHEKAASRSHLAALFWGESSESGALGSLRNAIYLIRKTLPSGFFLIERKSISLSDRVTLSSDLQEIERFQSLPRAQWGNLNSLFLDGLSLSDCELFENWLGIKRQFYAEKLTEQLELYVVQQQENNKTEDAVRSLRILIQQDSFEESYYLRLMRLYAQSGHPSKALKVYVTLKRHLQEELGTDPSDEVQKFYEELLRSRAEKTQVQTASLPFSFYGREKEVHQIRTLLVSESPFRFNCIALCGATGIGKTALLNQVLSQMPFANPIWCRAYEMSEKYALSPWNSFFSGFKILPHIARQIDPIKLHILKTCFPSFEVDYIIPENSDFTPLLQQCNPIQLGTMLAEITRMLPEQDRFLLVCEDFQWFDRESSEMLESFLLSEPKITGLVTLQRTEEGVPCSPIPERPAFKNSVRFYKIPLSPFNKQETRAFCELALGRSISCAEIELLQNESEGIPLLVAEFLSALREGKSLHTITERMDGVIESRIHSLTLEQQRILEHLSIFASEAFYNDFVALFDREKLQLAEDIDILCKKNFIRERVSGSNHLKLQFSHHRVQSYVYSKISEFKKRALHGKIAAILEKISEKAVWDKTLENETTYHYHKAADKTGALIFMLLRLRRHVIINHELFPIIEDSDLQLCGLPFSTQTTTERKLEQAKQLLLEAKSSFPASEQTLHASALFQEIQGGYDIYFGNYQDGAYSIEQALAYAETRCDWDMVMRCLLHLSFIGVQMEDGTKIRKAAQRLCNIAYRQKNVLFIAVGLRFLGVCQQIEGNFSLAEKLLKQSIRRLERVAKTSTRYTLNIVAAQNYIGEIYLRRGAFDAALAHFENCLSQCVDRNLFWGKPLFHSNIAYVFLCTHNYELADRHASEAIRLFETTPSGRKSSIAYSIKAFIEAAQGNVEKAQCYLQAGDQLCEPIMKKSWLALHLWVKAQIKKCRTIGRTFFHQSRKKSRRILSRRTIFSKAFILTHVSSCVRNASRPTIPMPFPLPSFEPF